jgi:hypothetical protein
MGMAGRKRGFPRVVRVAAQVMDGMPENVMVSNKYARDL